MVTETQGQTPGLKQPSRRTLIDWLSLTSQTESDRELRTVVASCKSSVSDLLGLRDMVRLKKSGNFGQGEKWERFGAQIKYTTRTECDLNAWDHQGRAAGCVNFSATGGSGIGGLPLLKAIDLLATVSELGFDRVRRLDLAVDVFNHPALSVDVIRSRLASGDWKIPRRDVDAFRFQGPITEAGALKQGATLYIGGRADARSICVYDKGLQKELADPCLRIEVRLTGEPAYEALWRLRQANDAAGEAADAAAVADRAVVGIVRSVFDVRDVSRYRDSGRLPQNWATASHITYPELMHPVFAEIAPLDLGSFKATGLFASRTRHLMRSSGKHLWRLAIICAAKGDDPGAVALTVGAPAAMSISDEDFQEMSQASGFTVAQLEQGELACLTALNRLHGLDADCIASDRTRLREELAVSLGGV